MHEREKDAAAIDQLAAGMNADAARASALVDERIRSARKRKALLGYDTVDNEPSDERELRGQHTVREADIAGEMAEQLDVIRTAAAKVQSLASEMRARSTNPA